MNKKTGAFLVRGSAVLVLLTFLACNIKCTRNQITNIQSQNAKNCEDKKEEKLYDSLAKLNEMLELLKEFSQVHIEISDSSSNSGNVIVGHNNTIIVDNPKVSNKPTKVASQKVERRQESVRNTTKQAQNQNQAENGSQVVSGMVYIYYNAPISR